MKAGLPISALMLLAASPAWATGSIHCQSNERGAPEIYLLVGRGAAVALQGKPLTAPYDSRSNKC